MGRQSIFKSVKTKFFQTQVTGSAHSPMLFVCDDGEEYYCKQSQEKHVSWNEQRYLINEAICWALGKCMGLPVLDFALVEFINGSYSSAQLTGYKGSKLAGRIGAGSRKVTTLITFPEISVASTADYESIENPYALLQIGLFDCWTYQTDRHKPENEHNILVSKGSRGQMKFLYAIDHAFAFGGCKKGMGPLSPYVDGTQIPDETIFSCGQFTQCRRFYDYSEIRNMIRDFFVACHDPSMQLYFNEVMDMLPKSWKIEGRYEVYRKDLSNYLFDKPRLERLEQQLSEYFCL